MLRMISPGPPQEKRFIFQLAPQHGGRYVDTLLLSKQILLLTQKDIAKKLGISQSYISRLEKRILQKLKTQLKVKAD